MSVCSMQDASRSGDGDVERMGGGGHEEVMLHISFAPRVRKG